MAMAIQSAMTVWQVSASEKAAPTVATFQKIVVNEVFLQNLKLMRAEIAIKIESVRRTLALTIFSCLLVF